MEVERPGPLAWVKKVDSVQSRLTEVIIHFDFSTTPSLQTTWLRVGTLLKDSGIVILLLPAKLHKHMKLPAMQCSLHVPNFVHSGNEALVSCAG